VTQALRSILNPWPGTHK